jgi:hypothetical protein
MAVVWKELAYAADVATLSSETAHDIGTTAAEGAATDASRHDHVHALGSSTVDNSTIALTAGVLSVKADGITAAQIADDAVGSEHIEALSAALDFAGNIATDLVLHTSNDAPTTPVVGKLWFEGDTTKTYICTSAA